MAVLSHNEPFPYLKLAGLSFAAFLAIMTETVPAGLLLDMSQDFGTSTGTIGQFLTAYAVGSVVAAIPVMTATRAVPRRKLLIIAVLFLAVFNAVTAMTNIVLIGYISRFVAGMAGGVVWGLVANYARSLVSEGEQGKALGFIGFGQPIALAFGVPLGSWGGSIVGWRAVFFALSIIAVGLAMWIRVTVPPRPGDRDGDSSLGLLTKVISRNGVVFVLFSLLGWVCAHNILYTYMSPFVEGVEASVNLNVSLLVFGVAAGTGIVVTTMVVDRHLYAASITCGLLFFLGLAVLAFFSGSAIAFLIGLILWGLGFGGAPTVLQTALALRAGQYADLA